MSTPSIAERVAAGVQWLDVNEPGWVERIDLERLALENCGNCVLGQIFGYYEDAPAEARLEAIFLGFERDGYPESNSRAYAKLTAEWRRVIEERRQAAGEAS